MGGKEKTLILCFATQGEGHIEGRRIRELLEGVSAESYPFDRSHKLRSALGLLRAAASRRPDLIVMEGTGLAGGIPLMILTTLLQIPYVVSSGDAVGPYLGLRSRAIGLLGGIYERVLCRRSAGFIGWTPYLVGRALTFGAPRGVTAAGWTRDQPSPTARASIREQLGIAEDALVVGLTGSLQWSQRLQHTYGAELVRAMQKVARRDVVACIVGDGSGKEHLQRLAGRDLGTRILLPGRVAPEAVADHLAALDIACLSQSVDLVGSLRYTTKLSEYLAAGLPVITGQTPLSYDLDEGYFWRLPGSAPWSDEHVEALAELLEGLRPQDLEERREAVRRRAWNPFDKQAQQRRVQGFIEDLLATREHRRLAARAAR